ncbi:MAG: diguanylate cyclase [Syntrophobacterales bacterium]|nr:MAG: diguanylate cyclase [Syntrophobacterales bacterium]
MKKQILVVEDERLIATDIHHKLQGMGYEVAAFAFSGEDAVKKAAELRPDLALMDIVLGPGIDGLEAARRIHASCNMPIVYVSSNITEDKMEEMKATNPFGFIVKPFEDRELRVTIEMALYRHQMEETLRKSEERYRALFENNPIETVIVDKRAAITGYNHEKVKSGNRLPRLGDIMYRDYAGKHKNDMYAELMECIESGVSKEFPDAHYGYKFLYIKISPFPEGAIITSIDVTESKRLEERLSHLATHDPLTGLPNRALFNDRLSLEMVRAQRSDKKLAVMLLDLDNFKEINDSWGHTVGDEVLKIIGRRLPEFLRKSDSIARMGGDEFLILLPEIEKAEDASRIGLKILSAFKKPFIVDTRELSTTTSLGFALYPDDGDETDILMKNADIAMYSVKEGGRNGCRRYDPRMREKAPPTGEDSKVTRQGEANRADGE